jgi:hypothetical protein
MDSLAGNIRHDLAHFRGLAGGHVPNADDDLVVRRTGRGPRQFPEARQQAAGPVIGRFE